jgi:hypothetical protein
MNTQVSLQRKIKGLVRDYGMARVYAVLNEVSPLVEEYDRVVNEKLDEHFRFLY